MATKFDWTVTKNGKKVFSWAGDFESLPELARNAILVKAKRIFTDRIGAESMTPDDAGKVCESIKKRLLDGTYGEGGGFGETLDPVFKAVRDDIAERANVKKGVHKRFPDWASLEKAVGKEAVEALKKLHEQARSLKLTIKL